MKERAYMQKLLHLAREERGVGLVEFAMTAWLMMFLLLGVFQFGYAMYAYQFTSYAAQQGARFAMVRGHTWSEHEGDICGTSAPPNFTMIYDCEAQSSDIQNYVQSLATGGINPSNITVNSNNWPAATPDGTSTACTNQPNSQGCLVKVTVSYTFNFIPFLRVTAVPMTATSEKVILQ
jgi:Flp pilus assembly protein TadG